MIPPAASACQTSSGSMPRMLPNRIWVMCCSVVTNESSTSPAANIPVNTTPSAASSFSRLCDWM